MNYDKVLSIVALAFVHLLFAMAILHRIDVLWMTKTMYLAVALFYVALYFLRIRQLRAALRRRLRNAAIVLGFFLSVFFFYNFTIGMSWWTVIAVWLGLLAAAYLFYDVIVLDQQEEAARLPV